MLRSSGTAFSIRIGKKSAPAANRGIAAKPVQSAASLEIPR
jgi:hypothetical protein